jgi:hypothetical protein
MHDVALHVVPLHRGREPRDRARVLRHDCSRGLHLDQRQPPRTRRDDEIHLETLRVAEVVELAPPAGGRLPLRDLRGDEPLVHRSQERRTLQFLG